MACDATITRLDLLQRIIALLVSLADLAELVSDDSYRVRRRVLAILRPAEAVAQRCVLDWARSSGLPVPQHALFAIGALAFADNGDDPADAAALAERFRAFALALAYIAAMLEHLSSQPVDWPADRPLSAHAYASLIALRGLASRTRAPP